MSSATREQSARAVTGLAPGPSGVRRWLGMRPRAQRNDAVRRLTMLAARLLLLAVLLAAWQFASGRWIDRILVSRPTEVADVLGGWISDGTIVRNAGVTLLAATEGFVIGVAVAYVLAVVLGRARWLGSLLEPFFSALYSIPLLATAPVLILWFGIGLVMKVVLAAVLVFFMTFSSCYSGVRDVDQRMVNAVRVMGGGRLDVLRHVILPSSLVWVAASLRLSIPYALVGAVVGEILASNSGLGYLVSRSTGQFDMAGSFAAITVLLVVGFITNLVAQALTGAALRWKG